MKVRGPAVTVQLVRGDNLMLHRAIVEAGPGDVIVVDASRYLECGVWGEVMTVAAVYRRVGGLVVDGSVRDTEHTSRLGFPVFSRGISIKATTKRCAGLINHPIECGGVAVNPGDLVIGDDDGVVVVAREVLAQVLEAARARAAREAELMSRLESGASTLELYGFDATLRDLGVAAPAH